MSRKTRRTFQPRFFLFLALSVALVVGLVLLASAALSLLLTAAVCEIPALAAAFSFTGLSLKQFGLALAIGFAVIPVVEIVKLFQRMAAKR